MKRIALVACAAKKLDHPAPAQDLYVSPLFRKSRAWAEANADAWYILSARWGLVHPASVIEPYDQTLRKITRDERERWVFQTALSVRRLMTQPTELIFLAGLTYRAPLLDEIRRGVCMYGGPSYRVTVPLHGLGIGQQLQWLTQALEEPGEGR